MENKLHISRFSAWAPGIANAGEWKEWAEKKRAIRPGPESPEIAFTDSLFRRRLSQISKMTVQVVHDLLPLDEGIKTIFISFRGELSRQYKINKMLIEDRALMPAAFSLSVFNAPIALASMACCLKGGYTAIYPGEDSFAAGLAAAQAALFSGTGDELLFVYADEEVPAEYSGLCPDASPALAFGVVLSRKPCPDPVSVSVAGPGDFLRQLILCKEMYASA